jgi:tetraacyldisaccharide 4'-kinase
MSQIRKKVEKAMFSEEKSRFFSFESVLAAASVLYSIVIRIRNRLYELKIFRQNKLQCKVISVGNITAGGTGKTPMTVYLAEKLTMLGYKIVVVSRGYKGNFEKKGGIISNGKEILIGSDDSGDEPFLMAAKLKDVPVIVGQNRSAAGLLGVRNFKPDIILLDDGFQHRKLFRDVDLLLLDSKRPFGNGRLLPGGILREPASSIRRADAFILTRSSSDVTAALNDVRAVSERQPVFEASNTFYNFNAAAGCVTDPLTCFKQEVSDNFSRFAGKKAVAFSGIAGNDNFRKTLAESGCDVAEFFDFPDHHRYSGDDMERVSKAVSDKGAELVITTEKDFARMGGKFDFPADLVVVGVKMCLKDEKSFLEFIMRKL